MTEYFTWRTVADDLSGDESARVLTAQFGDGYKQESKDGLNNTQQKWSVTTEPLRKTELIAVRDFLRDRGGAEAFFWTNSYGETLYFKCKSWKPQDLGGGWYVMSMSFEQDFKP